MIPFDFEVDTIRYKGEKPTRVKRQLRVEIPDKPEEISLRAWADYTAIRATAPKWFEQIHGGEAGEEFIPKDAWQQFVVFALKVICCLACNREELNETDLLSLPFGDYEQNSDGLLAIVAMMLGPIKDYQPKERETFTHRGVKYAMHTTYIDGFGQQWVGKDIRTAEAVDALQFEMVFFQRDEEGELLMPDATYRNLLALTCMLSRKILPDGDLEQPPVGLSERTEWMDKRMKEFADLDMTVGLDIDFFLPDSKDALLSILRSALHGKMAALQQRQRKAVPSA